MISPFAWQNNFAHRIKVHFYFRKVIFRDLWISKMDFLATDKIFYPGQKSFVLDNLGFVWDKKYFVRAEGQGISKNVPYLWWIARNSFCSQNIKIFFEYVDFYAKMLLVLGAWVRNLTTQWTLILTTRSAQIPFRN